MKRLALIALLLTCGGCGYRLATLDTTHRPTITVPYVEGDISGELTSALIHAIAKNTSFEPRVSHGRYRLDVTILSSVHNYIGFRYDRDEITGERIDRLQPDEERKTVKVEVQLVDTYSGKPILGPQIIEGRTDYDYVNSDVLSDLSFLNKAGRRESVLQFSLGQLDAVENAREAALTPLYERLASQIAFSLASFM